MLDVLLAAQVGPPEVVQLVSIPLSENAHRISQNRRQNERPLCDMRFEPMDSNSIGLKMKKSEGLTRIRAHFIT